MNFTIGVYDLFTYAVPGSLYSTLMLYIAARSGWFDPESLDGIGLPKAVVLLLGSYQLGHVTFGMRRRLERLLPGHAHGRGVAAAREEFRVRNVPARNRSFIDADQGLLQAAVEVHSAEGALEIRRLKAMGLMLRGCAPALLAGAVVAAVEIGTSEEPVFAVVVALLLVASAVGATGQGRRLTHWANIKTLECAHWIPGIDEGYSA